MGLRNAACSGQSFRWRGWGVDTSRAPGPRLTKASNIFLAVPSGFTQAQINNPFGPADWYPSDHPECPRLSLTDASPTSGRAPSAITQTAKGVRKCWRSGLPVSYFIHQMSDFQNGLRRSADDRKQNTKLMIAYAKAMTETRSGPPPSISGR